MGKKVMISLDSYEQRILIRALNDLRSQLISEDRATDPIDELMIKIADSKPRHILVAEKGIAREYR